MTNNQAVNWLINVRADIGKIEHQDLWHYEQALAEIIDLLSESERLTDKEQRIFLAAMNREEKVCKQVDEEFRDCREPYEDSLVRICHEITRKVKGVLWT